MTGPRLVQTDTGPARAWNVTALRTRFGEPVAPGMIGGRTSFAPVPVIKVPSSDSHIFLATRLDMVSSVVVIDIAAIDGMPVAQIADYAAMRALANTRPVSADAAAPTILSLFDPDGVRAPELTDFDLAYLRSLYDAGGNLPAVVKIGGVTRQLRKGEPASFETSLQRE